MNRFAAGDIIEMGGYLEIIAGRLVDSDNFEDNDNAALLADLREFDIRERRMIVQLPQIQTSPRITFPEFTGLIGNRILWTNTPDADGIPSVIIVNANEDYDAGLLLGNAAWGRDITMASVSLGVDQDEEIMVFARTPESLSLALSSIIVLAARTPRRNNGVLSIEGYISQATPENIRQYEVLHPNAFRYLLQREPAVTLQNLYLTNGTQDMILQYSSNTRFQFERCQFENGERCLLLDQQVPEDIVLNQWNNDVETEKLNEFLNGLLGQRYITRPRRHNANY